MLQSHLGSLIACLHINSFKVYVIKKELKASLNKVNFQNSTAAVPPGLLTLLMTLPWVAVKYNSDNFGMLEYHDISFEDILYPQGCNVGPENYEWTSRDSQRTPLQWDSTDYAVFKFLYRLFIIIRSYQAKCYVYSNTCFAILHYFT